MNVFQILLIQPLTNGLILFYNLLFQNMGFAIIGFSIFLRFLLNPLTKPYMESMKRIKEIEPLILKLKKKYANDQKKLIQAQTELYKQKNINPGAGCLPYVFQIIILIALFNVFTQVLSQNGDTLSKLNQILYNPLKLAEGKDLNMHFLYLDVRKPDVFNFSGLPFPVPGPFLILAGILQFLSAKMMQPTINVEKKIAKKTETETDDMVVAVQSSMIYMFPIMTLIFGVNFPSGLALYWLLFSVFQIYQQYRTSGWGSLTPFIRRLNLLK